MPDQLDNFTSPKTKSQPRIYAYSDPRYVGMLKVGFTSRTVEERMAEHYPTKLPGSTPPYTVVFNESAMYKDGGSFTDRAVHTVLRKKRFSNPDGEWFICTVEDVRAAWLAVRDRTENEENRDQNFTMRPEQEEAVEKTKNYFLSAHREGLGAVSK